MADNRMTRMQISTSQKSAITIRYDLDGRSSNRSLERGMVLMMHQLLLVSLLFVFCFMVVVHSFKQVRSFSPVPASFTTLFADSHPTLFILHAHACIVA